MLRDFLFVVCNYMQNVLRTLVHGSTPAVLVEKDFRFQLVCPGVVEIDVA